LLASELMDRVGSVYANLVGSSTSAEDGHAEIRYTDYPKLGT